MVQLVFTNSLKKDIKLLQKRGYDMELFKKAIRILEGSGNLPIIILINYQEIIPAIGRLI